MRGESIRRGSGVGAACAALVLGVLGTLPAAACLGVAPPPALIGYPSDGDVEVPTDVVPFYDLSYPLSALTSADFTLSSSAGDAIGLQSATAQRNILDLTLGKTLEPNTTYTLSATLQHVEGGSDVVDTVTFTTGAGPVSGLPAPPQAFLQHYQFGQPLASSCSPWAEGTCVAVSDALPIEETSIDEFGQEDFTVYLHQKPWFTDLSGINQGTPFRCVKLRTRAANATYSAPLVLCGADAPLFTLRGSERIACTSQGLTQDDALVTASAGGPSGSSAGSGGAAQAGAPAGSAGAAPAGAPELPSQKASACSLGSPSKSSASPALGALFALALVARFRRTRRARIGR